MVNKGKFKVGTRFRGNVNGAEMEVDEIRGIYVMIRDVRTGLLHVTTLKTLERCAVTILDK